MKTWLGEIVGRVEGTYPSVRYKSDKSFLDVTTFRRGDYDAVSSMALYLPEQETLTQELEILGKSFKKLGYTTGKYFRLNTPNLGLRLELGYRAAIEYRLAELYQKAFDRTEQLGLLCELLEVDQKEFLPELEERTKEVSDKITDMNRLQPVTLPVSLTEKNLYITFNADAERSMYNICAKKLKPKITALDAVRSIEDVYGPVLIKNPDSYRRGRYFYSEFASARAIDNIETPVVIDVGTKNREAKYIPNITHDWGDKVAFDYTSVTAVSPRPKIKLSSNLYKEEAEVLEKIVPMFEEE